MGHRQDSGLTTQGHGDLYGEIQSELSGPQILKAAGNMVPAMVAPLLDNVLGMNEE